MAPHLPCALAVPLPQVIQRDWRVLGHVNALWGIVTTIEGSMGWDFDAVHIRRGDKLDPSRWPHLDFDTQPAQ